MSLKICEKLGAAHLLLHGIYAFKVDAIGARTDLVLIQPIVDEEVFQVAEELVLTEWKKVTATREAAKQAASARKQAERCAAEPLAGLELTAYRYIVLVSEHRIDELENTVENGITYRHINIAVKPQAPSVEASLQINAGHQRPRDIASIGKVRQREEMTVLDNLEALLNLNKGLAYCDDCITKRLDLTVRQHANHKTRFLEHNKKSAYTRGKGYCADCKSITKLVSWSL